MRVRNICMIIILLIILSGCTEKTDYEVKEGVVYYVLVDESFENNDPSNPNVSILVRQYDCYDGIKMNSYPQTHMVAIDKVGSMAKAKESLKKTNPGSLKLLDNTIVSQSVKQMWKLQNYDPEFEYHENSPAGLKYEELQPIINSELFVPIDKIVIDINLFKADEIVDDVLKSYLIKGLYDFDCDGKKDIVNLHIKFRDNKFEKSVLQIRDSAIEYEFDNPYEVYVVDLDTEDEFIEFAVYDDGPSGDPCLIFFRYTGDEILLLGEVNGYSKFDSKGRIITSSANFVCPDIVFEAAEIIDNKIVYNPIDYTKYLNNEYKACNDFQAYFKAFHIIPENFVPSYDIELTPIAKDSIIKINHIEFEGSEPCWYEVELNGIKGILYFWLGD